MIPTLVRAPAGDEAARRLAVEIIDFMQCEYGAKYAQQWGNVAPDKMIEHWAQRLSGYTAGEVRRGITSCGTRTFVPTLPEFLALCRPPIDPEQAFYVAVDGVQARQRGEIGNWPHPAIYWASVRIGHHDMLAAGYSALKGRWANALQDVLSKGKWAEIPEPALALPAPGASVTSSDEARKRLEQLGATGAVRRPSADGSKVWAERIIARNAAGKDVPGIAALNMARKALGITDEVSHV